MSKSVRVPVEVWTKLTECGLVVERRVNGKVLRSRQVRYQIDNDVTYHLCVGEDIHIWRD